MRRNTAASTHSPTILPPLLQDGLLPGDEVDHLHLEDVPGKAQRCFTAFDCGIKVGKGKLLLTLYQQKVVTLPHPHHQVFLLSSGKQLVDLPSLHSRPVTSLLFFRPLRLLITAAKDGASTYPFMSSKPSLLSSLITNRRGWDAYICTLNWAVMKPRNMATFMVQKVIRTNSHTVKVWDSSWQLCCTFVGHCGAVTSLVPYPCGPTILSGSLDATIRVWNLKTQNQVEM